MPATADNKVFEINHPKARPFSSTRTVSQSDDSLERLNCVRILALSNLIRNEDERKNWNEELAERNRITTCKLRC